jgi:hypothetical protein
MKLSPWSNLITLGSSCCFLLTALIILHKGKYARTQKHVEASKPYLVTAVNYERKMFMTPGWRRASDQQGHVQVD